MSDDRAPDPDPDGVAEPQAARTRAAAKMNRRSRMADIG